MASFYLPLSDLQLAEAIASASAARVIERPLSKAVEIHGQRLVVSREMIRNHLKAYGLEDTGGMLEKATWAMLKRNARGRLTQTATTLTVEGTTEPGEEP